MKIKYDKAFDILIIFNDTANLNNIFIGVDMEGNHRIFDKDTKEEVGKGIVNFMEKVINNEIQGFINL